MEVSLDPLPLKRVLAMEENGTEHLPPELSQEEKFLALLGRIDFGQEFKKLKKEDEGSKKDEKEKEIVQVWPWQGLVDHLQQAHQELAIILDVINHVEASEAVTVARMERPKLQPQEICSDYALRAASKLHHFRNVGKYLKRSAQALEQQVEREAVFYGALMRLQRNWKVKRQRGVAAGPVGSAGFSIDLGTSESSPCIITLEQDSVGLLTAHLPAGLSLSSLHVTLHSKQTALALKFGKETERLPVTTKEMRPDTTGLLEGSKPGEKGVGQGVDRGATSTQAMLRQIQTANFEAQVFEWVGRQALSLSPHINVTGLSDTCLQLSLGSGTSLNVHLIPMASLAGDSDTESTVLAPRTPDHQHMRILPNEGSLGVCLQQAYQHFLHARQDQSSAKETGKVKDVQSEAAGLVKHVSAIMRHRVACDRIISVLEKQVHGVPELRLSSHPTWHAQVSTWNLWLDIPDSTVVGRWQASVVLREDALTIVGLPARDDNENLTSVPCPLSELSPFLLFQMAAHLVAWLHAEASGMGVETRLDLLSVTFEFDDYEDVSIVASPDVRSHTINWSLGQSDSSSGDFDSTNRILGALPLEALKGIVIDLVSEKMDAKSGGDSVLRGEAFSEH